MIPDDGNANEMSYGHGLKTEAKGVVAVRFEFQNGLLGFNVYREIIVVGQPATGVK